MIDTREITMKNAQQELGITSFTFKPTPSKTKGVCKPSFATAVFGSANLSEESQSADDLLNSMTHDDVESQYGWIKGIPIPKYTRKDLDDLRKEQSIALNKYDEEIEEKKEKAKEEGKIYKPNTFSRLWFEIKQRRVRRKLEKKIDKEFETVALQRLPKDIKKKLNRYKRFGYYIDRIFKGEATAKTRLIELQGPPAIKAQQAWITDKKPEIQEDKTIVDALKKPEVVSELLADAKGWHKALVKIGLPIFLYFKEKEINNFEIKEQLVFNATSTDIKEFSDELNAIKKGLKAKGIEITEVGKPNRAASIAQTFIAKTKNKDGSDGQILLKFIKPGLSPDIMGDYKEYLYFKNLVELGTTPRSKYASAADAELNSEFLKRETYLVNEKENLEVAIKQKEAMGLKGFNIPAPVAVTEDGRGLAMEIAGNVTFSELSQEQVGRLLGKSGPDIAAYQLLNPEIHMDMTGGNVMSQAQVEGTGKKKTITLNDDARTALIDFGRVLKMDTDRHQQLINLMQAYLSAPRLSSTGFFDSATQPEDYLLNNDFRQATTEFLKNSEGSYKDAITEINTLLEGELKPYFEHKEKVQKLKVEMQQLLDKHNVSNKTDLPEGDDKDKYSQLSLEKRNLRKPPEGLEEPLSRFNELVQHLDPFLGGLLNKNPDIYKQDVNKEGQDKAHRWERPTLKKGYNSSPALFDVVFNTMAFNRLQAARKGQSIEELSELPIPYKELQDIRKKFYGTMSQYFISPANTEEEAKAKEQIISALDEPNGMEVIKSLFHYAGAVKESSYFYVTELLEAVEEGNKEQFNEYAKKIKDDKFYLKDLETNYLVDQRVHQMVETLSSEWQKKQGNMTETDLNVFKNNLAVALMGDFAEKIRAAKDANTTMFD